MFYERRMTSTFQLYFLDVVDYGSRLVMACGACNTLYATGDAANAEPDMITKATKAAGEIGSAIATGATKAVGKLSGAARNLLESATPKPSATSSSARDDEAVHDDPLRDEDEAMEARFRELETRVRIDTGEK